MQYLRKDYGAANKSSESLIVNRTRLPLLCEKSVAILLVLVGLTAGQQAVK